MSLFPKYAFRVPVEAASVSPDIFANKSLAEIAELQLLEGNKKRTLGDLFEIEGEVAQKPEDVKIGVQGNVRKVTRIGSGMTAGEIAVFRDVGIHLGEEMKGGKITVAGNADSWLGAMMKGGMIEVKGDAGDYVGAAYRGSVNGMRGGTIIIHGNAGNELGCFMRKGLIKVHGNAAQFVGMHMKDGAIFVAGNSETRAGAEMIGGRVVIGGRIEEILPTFSFDGVKPTVKVNGDVVVGPFYVFVGDKAENGEGKLYVAQSVNPHLKFYEQYL